MRLLECLRLRMQDLDLWRHRIVVRGGKGDRGRITVMPVLFEDPLRRHLAAVRRCYARDIEWPGWGSTCPADRRMGPRMGPPGDVGTRGPEVRPAPPIED